MIEIDLAAHVGVTVVSLDSDPETADRVLDAVGAGHLQPDG